MPGAPVLRAPNPMGTTKMQVTETLNEGLKRGYNIVVTAAELDDKVNEKLTEAQPEVEMKGFRKGKVPMALLKKQFGQRLLGEAMQETIDGAMNKHFEDSGERPALQPEVKMTNEDWKEGDDVSSFPWPTKQLPEIPEVDLTIGPETGEDGCHRSDEACRYRRGAGQSGRECAELRQRVAKVRKPSRW